MVLTTAQQLVRVVGIRDVTSVCVAITHAASTNADIFNGIEILEHKTKTPKAEHFQRAAAYRSRQYV
jgi:hypothetical protein